MSEAGVAPARAPAICGARTENSADQRTPKIMCEQSADPSSSDMYMYMHMYFYMYKYMCLFRDLESGWSKTKSVRA